MEVGHHVRPAGPQHACELGDGRVGVGQMRERERADREIEGAVLER
jgi:hypothetical protein